MKSAVGLFASPRKDGITTSLAKEAMRALSEKGYEIKIFYLSDMNIKPCMACMACLDTHKCVINDDQRQIVEAIDNSDFVVFSSPVYCSNVTSSGKAMIDRTMPLYEKTKFGPKRTKAKPSKVLIITSCGAPLFFSVLTGMTTGCIKAMETPFKFMKCKIRNFNVGGFESVKDKKFTKKLNSIYKFAKSLA